MSTNLTTAEQLSSLASAIKAYTDAKQQETIAIVIDAIQSAGSSAATETTEPEETETAIVKTVSCEPSLITIQQGSTAIATVSVVSQSGGTYSLELSGIATSWATLNNNIITIAPPSSVTVGSYQLTVRATGANNSVATADLTVTVTAKVADVT